MLFFLAILNAAFEEGNGRRGYGRESRSRIKISRK